MAKKQKGPTYITDQLTKNRISNKLKKENSKLSEENKLYKNFLKKLGYDV